MRYVVDNVMAPLKISFIKQVHDLLVYGTYADQNHKVAAGEFRLQGARGGGSSQQLNKEMGDVLCIYEKKAAKLEQILDFYVKFEALRPFDDYNGRVGWIIMMKECLRYGIDPFIIDDKRRGAYNNGIAQWKNDPQVLLVPVLEAQERFRRQMEVCKLMQYCRS